RGVGAGMQHLLQRIFSRERHTDFCTDSSKAQALSHCLTQRLLCALLAFEIGVRSVPFDDFPGLIAQRTAANKKPPILPIKAAKTAINLKRLCQIYGFMKYFQYSGKIVGVNGGFPAPVQSLFLGEAGVLQPALIEEISGAIWTGRPSQRGNCI